MDAIDYTYKITKKILKGHGPLILFEHCVRVETYKIGLAKIFPNLGLFISNKNYSKMSLFH